MFPGILLNYRRTLKLQFKKQFDFLFSVFVMSDVKLIKECYNEAVFTGRSSGMLTCVLAKGKNGIVLSDGQTWVDQRRFTLVIN